MNPERICGFGGIAALTIALGYLVIISPYAGMGAPPHDTQQTLARSAGNPLNGLTILWLSVLPDLLFLVVAAALYLALRHTRKVAMTISFVLVALFVILDLTVTWSNYAALIALGGRYATATDKFQRAAVIGAAEYPIAVADSSLLFFCNALALYAGSLIAGLVSPENGSAD
jgi:hypothetical protein